MKPLLAVHNVTCTVCCCVSPPDNNDDVDGVLPTDKLPECDEKEMSGGDDKKYENEMSELSASGGQSDTSPS